MAEQHESSTFEPGVGSLHVKKLSRLSFQPLGDLREALLEVYSEEARIRMSQSTLFLYTQTQVENLKPRSLEYRKSEQRDNNLKKRLGAISARQFDLAKWVRLVNHKTLPGTGFQFNVLFDDDTQVRLRESVNEGLNQTLFGRRAIFATLWMPEDRVVSDEDKWLEAIHAVKRAAWGNDDLGTVSTTLSAPENGGGAKVTHIDWTSPPTTHPEGSVT